MLSEPQDHDQATLFCSPLRWHKEHFIFYLFLVIVQFLCQILQCDRENHEQLKYFRNVFIVLRPISAKISARQLATKLQKLTNILACSLVSHAQLAFILQHNNIPEIFLVYFTVFSV